MDPGLMFLQRFDQGTVGDNRSFFGIVVADSWIVMTPSGPARHNFGQLHLALKVSNKSSQPTSAMVVECRRSKVEDR